MAERIYFKAGKRCSESKRRRNETLFCFSNFAFDCRMHGDKNSRVSQESCFLNIFGKKMNEDGPLIFKLLPHICREVVFEGVHWEINSRSIYCTASQKAPHTLSSTTVLFVWKMIPISFHLYLHFFFLAPLSFNSDHAPARPTPG